MNSIEISSELSDDQIKEYQELFRLVDFNEVGSIDKAGLEYLLELTHVNVSDLSIMEMMDEVNSEGVGIITFTAFLGLMTTRIMKHHSKKDILRAFSTFAHADAPIGCILPSELKTALTYIGLKQYDAFDAESLLQSLPKDNEGYVHYTYLLDSLIN